MKNCRHRRQGQQQPPPKLFYIAAIAILTAALSRSSSRRNHRHNNLFFVSSLQFVEPCESIIPYWYDSGNVSFQSTASTSSSTTTTTISSTVLISHPSAPWIQLDLSQTVLAPNAKLLLVGDYATQEILHDSNNNNHGYSAVFEGDTISLNLVHDTTTTSSSSTSTTENNHNFLTTNIFGRLFSSWTNNNKPKVKSSSRIIVSNIHVGLCEEEQQHDFHDPTTITTSNEGGKNGIAATTITPNIVGGAGDIIATTICGNDDRVQSYDVRQGRMGGCTAWLISEDVFLRAGHCGTPNANSRLHFTFYNTAAPPSDQYAVDLLSYRFMNGDGKDWAAGRLLPNSETGKLPGVAQSEKCGTANCGWYRIGAVPTSVSGNRITITGYGSVDPQDVRNQETHTGDLLEITSTRLKYDADTGGGNSGSPVLHVQTGKAVGIHIAGGCTSSGGRSNIGQRIDDPDLVEHYTRLTLTCSRNSNCDDGNWCNGDETCSNGKCQFGPPRYTNGCPTPKPTAQPTFKPTISLKPTAKPSTRMPTFKPTSIPTLNPTSNPTQVPTSRPTSAKPSTSVPTSFKSTTSAPSFKPTSMPSSKAPSAKPSKSQTDATTQMPTSSTPTTATPITSNPTMVAPTTLIPTASPTTLQPTTSNPTIANPITRIPTFMPTTVQPTPKPTTANPTTRLPTFKPTTSRPTSKPTIPKPTKPTKTASPTPTA